MSERIEITTAADRARALRRYRQGEREWVEPRPRRPPADPEPPPLPEWPPAGWTEITLVAYTDGRQLVIPEQEGLWVPDETTDDEHNCDAQGCGWGHVLARFNLPRPAEEGR